MAVTGFIAPLILGGIAGAIAGVVVTAWRLRHRQEPTPPSSPIDEFTSAEIDQAAAAWAAQSDRPEVAAQAMADKLRLLHRLGQHQRRQP